MKPLKSFDEYVELNEGLLDRFKLAVRLSKKLFGAFKEEGKETSEMFHTFTKELRTRLRLDSREDSPSEEEIRAALKQLKEVPKLAPYAIMLLMSPIPFTSVFYTMLGLNLYRLSGGKINILPKNIKRVFMEETL